jgi:outer membrane protein OmpA-like peptidoglycan-associated protein
MRSLLFLPLPLMLLVACSQNPHVDVSSTPAAAHSSSQNAVANETASSNAASTGDDRCSTGSGPADNSGCLLNEPAPEEAKLSTSHERQAPSSWASLPDRDGDGVPDIYDKCPDVPGQIFNDGCPIDAPLADRDGDGVPDIYDKCPDQPGPIWNDGCPVEGPRPEFISEHYSCPYKASTEEEERTVLLQVHESLKFDYDRSLIKEHSLPPLHMLEHFMRKYPLSHLYMVGHADDRGSESYNLSLSRARVYAVKDFLANNGIDPRRISVDAHGDDDPMISVNGLSGAALDHARMENRRVDLQIRYEERERVR